MAHYKRRKPKTYDYPMCPWGMQCSGDIAHGVRTNNAKQRRTSKDYQQPQFYDEAGRKYWQETPGSTLY